MAGLINRRRLLRWGSVWAGSLFLATCDQQQTLEKRSVAQPLQLTSSAFSPDALIPSEFTCDGANHSPPLSWDTPPPETQSLVLLMEDPDAPNGTFIHWVIYDLPPQLQSLPPAIPAQPFLSQGGIQGKNDFGRYGYGGPCPPGGVHRYWFRLYAVDKLLDLPPGVAHAAVQTALKDHILAEAELMGRYGRQR